MCLDELNMNVYVMGQTMEHFHGTSERGLCFQMTALLEGTVPCFSGVTLCPSTPSAHSLCTGKSSSRHLLRGLSAAVGIRMSARGLAPRGAANAHSTSKP